jgi:hypothetical protein
LGATAARDWLYDFGGARDGRSGLAGRGQSAFDFGAIWKDLKEFNWFFADRFDFRTILKRSKGNRGA